MLPTECFQVSTATSPAVWRHSDVIVIEMAAGIHNQIPFENIFRIFHILKIKKNDAIYNLLTELPSL